MSLIRINRDPSTRDLRVFAGIGSVIVGAWAVASEFDGESHRALLLTAMVGVLAVVAIVTPRSLRLLYVLASAITFPIGFVVSHVVLAAVYFLILTPIGWLLRATGHDPLRRRFEPNRKSYWESKSPAPAASSYLKQY